MGKQVKEGALEIGRRIKHLREQNGLTQPEFGKKIGRCESAVRMWELGLAYPEIDILVKISALFGVPTDYILNPSYEKKNAAPILPVYRTIKRGIPIEDNPIECHISVDEAMTLQGGFMGLMAPDAYMNPQIRKDDIVIIMRQNTLYSGDIGVFLSDGVPSIHIGRVRLEDDDILLHSPNTAFSDISYTLEDIAKGVAEILGRVVEIRRKY